MQVGRYSFRQQRIVEASVARQNKHVESAVFRRFRFLLFSASRLNLPNAWRKANNGEFIEVVSHILLQFSKHSIKGSKFLGISNHFKLAKQVGVNFWLRIRTKAPQSSLKLVAGDIDTALCRSSHIHQSVKLAENVFSRALSVVTVASLQCHYCPALPSDSCWINGL